MSKSYELSNFMHDDELLTKAGTVRKLLEPTCGTGGMLSEARKYLREPNLGAKLYVYGQDVNPSSYEINFSRHFYRFTPPRPLKEIDADLRLAEAEIVRLLQEVTA